MIKRSAGRPREALVLGLIQPLSDDWIIQTKQQDAMFHKLHGRKHLRLLPQDGD